MTPLEAALIIIVVAILLFFIYYYWKGAKGDVSLARPVESRVDEYLDRRFETDDRGMVACQPGKAPVIQAVKGPDP